MPTIKMNVYKYSYKINVSNKVTAVTVNEKVHINTILYEDAKLQDALAPYIAFVHRSPNNPALFFLVINKVR